MPAQRAPRRACSARSGPASSAPPSRGDLGLQVRDAWAVRRECIAANAPFGTHAQHRETLLRHEHRHCRPHRVHGDGQGTHALAVRVGSHAGRRQRHCPNAERMHLGVSHVLTAVDGREESQQSPRRKRGDHSDVEQPVGQVRIGQTRIPPPYDVPLPTAPKVPRPARCRTERAGTRAAPRASPTNSGWALAASPSGSRAR